MVKKLPANARDMGLIPSLGRSFGEGNGNSFQYACLGNPMNRAPWWATQRAGHDLATKQQQGKFRKKWRQ